MNKHTSRAARVVAATAVLCMTTAGVAQAHVEVVSTTPSAGSTAKTSLAAAKVRFSGPIRRGTLRVTGPGGKSASKGSGGRDPRSIKRLMAELRSGLGAGKYTARWTIVSGDGHAEQGSFTFRLKK